MGNGKSTKWVKYAYETGGILPDGSKVPDIPTLKIMLVRKDIGKFTVGDALIDTGFDYSFYSNIEVSNFLEGLKPAGKIQLKSVAEPIECEIYETEAFIATGDLKRVKNLGKIKIYVPVNVENLSDDALIGREILNSLTMKLDGKYTEISERPK